MTPGADQAAATASSCSAQVLPVRFGGQGDAVVDGEHAGHASSQELGLIPLVVPGCGAGQGDEAVAGFGLNGHRDRTVEHERVQHLAPQLGVIARAAVCPAHLQLVADLGDPVYSRGSPACLPLVPQAGHGSAQGDGAGFSRDDDLLAVDLGVPGQLGGDIALQLVVRHGLLFPLRP